jgi:hypothetical protein
LNLSLIRSSLQAEGAWPFDIHITCSGAEELPLEALEDLQGNLKQRTEEDIIKILRSIRQYGFSFPFFYCSLDGHRYCMDGHGRIMALSIYCRLGGSLPSLPCCRIEARDLKEAKNKLLRMNSRYGAINSEALLEFIDDLDLNPDDLSLPDVDMDALVPLSLSLIDNSQEEDTRTGRTKPGHGAMVVTIGTFSELVDMAIGSQIIKLIGERYEGRRIEGFFRECLRFIT